MARHMTGGAVGVSLTATPTTPEFELGTRMTSTDGVEWMYVKANDALAQYAAVGIDENWLADELTHAIASDGWTIGWAQSAFATSDYGWIALSGSNINAKLLTACAADVALYTTDTAGALDDASMTAAINIDGVVAVATITAATNAEIIATYPRSTTF